MSIWDFLLLLIVKFCFLYRYCYLYFSISLWRIKIIIDMSAVQTEVLKWAPSQRTSVCAESSSSSMRAADRRSCNKKVMNDAMRDWSIMAGLLTTAAVRHICQRVPMRLSTCYTAEIYDIRYDYWALADPEGTRGHGFSSDSLEFGGHGPLPPNSWPYEEKLWELLSS